MKTIRQTSQLVIDALLKDINLKGCVRVLEPSAGIGLLADGIIRHNPLINLECVELNHVCKTKLLEKGYNVVGNDFFLFNPDYKYDFVIGAPNFRDNIDCKHVMKMYDLVKPNGIVSSIMSPYWTTGNSYLQVEFRKWLQNKEYTIEMLPDNSFMEEGNTVPTIVIKIRKNETV